MNNIFEGRFDRYRFKAVFLVGIPASGKTEFYNSVLMHKNLKHIDSDKVMMFLIKKYGGNPKDTKNYSKWENSIKSKLDMMAKIYKEGGLGLVIDGTGKNIDKIKEIKKDIERYGYETSMIYIKTPLNKSIKRSKERGRAVDLGYIKDVYRSLSKNIEEYKKMFTPFIEVSDVSEHPAAEKKISSWLNKWIHFFQEF